MRRHAFTIFMALLITAVGPVLLGACGHRGDGPGPHHRDGHHHERGSGDRTDLSTTTSADGSPPLELHTPDTLADGAFPPVLDPERDGSLDGIRVRLTTVAEADQPMALVARPGHDGQLFLAEREGLVRLVTIAGDGDLEVHDPPLVDLTDRVTTEGETGLLGLAFATDGATVYLSYNVADHDSRVDAAPVEGQGPDTTVGEPTNLFEVDQGGTIFHKGGNLIVDDRDLLYAGFGDGGPQNDADEHAQDTELLLGKILRIDPTRPTDDRPYGIPDTNPFADGEGGRPEIWLTGLRNPWRFSIDPANGDIWIGDVGQDAIEEVDRLPGGPVADGRNLGWSGYEGTFVFEADRIPDEPTVPPIFELSHDGEVCSITGGVVYRGERIEGLDGVYLYSDLCRTGVYGIRAETPDDGIGRVTDERLLAGSEQVGRIISFATDADGEVYVLSMDDTIRRIDPAD